MILIAHLGLCLALSEGCNKHTLNEMNEDNTYFTPARILTCYNVVKGKNITVFIMLPQV